MRQRHLTAKTTELIARTAIVWPKGVSAAVTRTHSVRPLCYYYYYYYCLWSTDHVIHRSSRSDPWGLFAPRLDTYTHTHTHARVE